MRTSVLFLVALSACVDPSVGRDRDGDGFFTSELDGDDCDDDNASVNPDASEACGNGIDDNCDGIIDDAGVGERSWFVDNDMDGFAGPTPFTGCTAPTGAFADLSLGEDCDDTRSDINPAANEIWYDGVDQDCAGDNDNDADGDGFVALSQGGDDCDDVDGAVNPSAVEVCNNGVDDDCDGGPNQCEYAGEVDLDGVAVWTLPEAARRGWMTDVTGDGVTDVVVTPTGVSFPIPVWIYAGPDFDMTSTPYHTIEWSSGEAHIVADTSGDGLLDIAFSPGFSSAPVVVFNGPFAESTVPTHEPDLTVTLHPSPGPTQNEGAKIANAIWLPDQNGDNVAELLVSTGAQTPFGTPIPPDEIGVWYAESPYNSSTFVDDMERISVHPLNAGPPRVSNGTSTLPTLQWTERPRGGPGLVEYDYTYAPLTIALPNDSLPSVVFGPSQPIPATYLGASLVLGRDRQYRSADPTIVVNGFPSTEFGQLRVSATAPPQAFSPPSFDNANQVAGQYLSPTLCDLNSDGVADFLAPGSRFFQAEPSEDSFREFAGVSVYYGPLVGEFMSDPPDAELAAGSADSNLVYVSCVEDGALIGVSGDESRTVLVPAVGL